MPTPTNNGGLKNNGANLGIEATLWKAANALRANMDKRQRHRTWAGFGIGDDRHADIFRHALMLAELRQTSMSQPDGNPYNEV